MELSFSMIKDCLEDFSPELEIKHRGQNRREITGYRLYYPQTCLEKGILYIAHADLFYGDGDKRIICKHGSDCMLLHTDDLIAVFNRIQDFFVFCQHWHAQCKTAISAGCSLAELLSLAKRVIRHPLLVVDSTQVDMAHSPDIVDAYAPEDWDWMVSHQCLPDDRMVLFNRTYASTFYDLDLFKIPAGIFATGSYCRHIFIQGERAATIILKILQAEPTDGQLDFFDMVTQLIREWIISSDANRGSSHTFSFLAQVLSGKKDRIPALRRQLALWGWEPRGKKQLFILGCLAQLPQICHLARTLSNGGLGVLTSLCEGKIVVLCNLELTDLTPFIHLLQTIINDMGCCGASSLVFTDLKQLYPAYVHTASILEHSPQKPGMLYNCKNAPTYVIAKIISDFNADPLLHPALSVLREYDVQHNTDYYQTLFLFLQNNCGLSQTARKLYIHRNTLVQRLEKIQDLWPIDLDDPEERFHLLFSFYARL